MIIFRILLAAFGVALVFFGLAASVSPIPFGFVFILLGLLILIAVAPASIRRLRKHWRWFDGRMEGLEKHLPKWIARRLRRTDIEHEDEPRETETG